MSQKSSKAIKTVHNIFISVFVQATEDKEKVTSALQFFLPDDVDVEVNRATGHFGNLITILTAKMHKTHEISRVLEFIKVNLSKREMTQLLRDLEDHVDEDANLIIRFDKQEAANKRLKLGKEDPILLRVKIAAYPASKKQAVKVARGLLRDSEIF